MSVCLALSLSLGYKADIWSMGVILHALLCGYLPFEDQNTSKLYKKILSGTYHIPKFVSTGERQTGWGGRGDWAEWEYMQSNNGINYYHVLHHPFPVSPLCSPGSWHND